VALSRDESVLVRQRRIGKRYVLRDFMCKKL
jgi:hypothetical protein